MPPPLGNKAFLRDYELSLSLEMKIPIKPEPNTLKPIPSRERSHIPPKGKRKIIDSNMPNGMEYVTDWWFQPI